MKILVTGGHLTPAYSFIEEAQLHHTTVEVIGSLGPGSLEASEFAKLGVTYHSIFPLKYNRFQKLASILKFPLIIYPLLQAAVHLIQFRPDRVLVFGGYTALPVAAAAFFLQIPVYLHEQTRAAGLANRIISRFATGCATSYQDTSGLDHHKNKLVTGNLLRRIIWNPPANPSFNLTGPKPILFITGGNQGSAVILQVLEPLLSQLTAQYQLVVQFGNHHPTQTLNSTIVAKPWFGVEDMAWLLSHSKIVICRGGANTTAELMVFGTPAIIIPLPIASQDEQAKNAAAIANSGSGLVISQTQLTEESLLAAIRQIESDYSAFKANAKNLSRLQDATAAHKLYQFVSSSP